METEVASELDKIGAGILNMFLVKSIFLNKCTNYFGIQKIKFNLLNNIFLKGMRIGEVTKIRDGKKIEQMGGIYL